MDSDPLHGRVVAGLAKIGLALRTQQWQATGQRGLNPTQGQILTILRARPDGLSLAELAGELGVKPATASASVTALVRKRLVGKRPLPKNRRAVVIRLTASGQREADRSVSWHDMLFRAVDQLSEHQQEVLLVALMKMIRALQEDGAITQARMCLTCRYFKPFQYNDLYRPHHCDFAQAAFGTRELRLDCAEHQPSADADATLIWTRFTRQGGD
jgi:DNA-binding MarR family transcriptional regulator